MKIKQGKGTTEYGPGVQINLKAKELALAIYAYLTAKDVHIQGPATIRVNGELCESAEVYVDPSGFVIAKGEKWDGNPKNS